jgi:molecular chaperone Hsp33
MLAATVTGGELLRLPSTGLLHRLFHEESLRLFEPEPLRFDCGCSRERIGRVIEALGRDEAEDIIGARGVIRVTCEFCNARHDFDAVDVAGLFEQATSAAPPTPTRH